MREIKFRGKRVDNGEWVYGSFCLTTHYAGKPIQKPVIIAQSELCNCCLWKPDSEDKPVKAYEVDPNTVGQYTGLKDKNGKEIYESDIVTANWYDYEEPSHTLTGEVIYAEGWLAFAIWDEQNKTMSEINGNGYYSWDIEVIGNIHDNPDLLEVTE
jgi:uncharacterized phage protein (TIGR01671 family)